MYNIVMYEYVIEYNILINKLCQIIVPGHPSSCSYLKHSVSESGFYIRL
jgi:hypothetical protein